MLQFIVSFINDYTGTVAIYELLSQRVSLTMFLIVLGILEHTMNIEHNFILYLCMKGSSNHVSSQER